MPATRWYRRGLLAFGLIALALGAFAAVSAASAGPAPAHASAIAALEYAL